MVHRRTTFLQNLGLDLGPGLDLGLGLGPGPDLGLGLGLGLDLDFGPDLGLGFGPDLGLGLGLHSLVEGPEGKPDFGLRKTFVAADFGHCWPRRGSNLGQMKGGAVSRNQFVFILCHFRFEHCSIWEY
jgi:hypothetical protein